MTDGQYRALVAYLNYWTPMYRHFGLEQAMQDVGITDNIATVIRELAEAGHVFDEATGLLIFTVKPTAERLKKLSWQELYSPKLIRMS